jgi:hypothetical protein
MTRLVLVGLACLAGFWAGCADGFPGSKCYDCNCGSTSAEAIDGSVTHADHEGLEGATVHITGTELAIEYDRDGTDWTATYDM